MEITGSIDFNEVVYTAVAEEPTYDTLIAEDGLSFEDPAYNGNSIMQLVFTDDDSSNLSINLYHLRFEAPAANVSGRDTNTMSVNFTALVNPLLGKAIDISITGTGLDDGSGAPSAY